MNALPPTKSKQVAPTIMSERRAAPRSSEWGVPNTAAVSIPSELAFDGINHAIDGNTVLTDVSLTVPSGTVTCLLGPSGSGKTTLLRIAAGMIEQSSGNVLLDRQAISGAKMHTPPEKRGIGLVFQDYALFPHLTILKNVCFGLKHLKRGDRKPQALQMLTRVGLDDRAHDYPHHLSGGEQQRVALARAMVPRPGVLLMDEPFSGLDSRLRDAVREETLGILRETRATSVIVTHDPEEALTMGDQIVLLNQGRVEQAGDARTLYFSPVSLFAAQFFSELNTISGFAQVGHIDTPFGAMETDLSDGQAGIVAIRTNAITVKETADDQVGAKGRIIGSRFTGDHEQLRIGVSGLEYPIRARVPAGMLSQKALSGQANVSVSASEQGTFVFPA